MAVGRPENVTETLEELREESRNREQMALTPNNSSVQQVIQAQAIDESSAEPGQELDQWWFPDEGFVVIDMESGIDGD